MEVYKIWADLSIKGNAHKKMEQFSELTKKANKSLNDLTKGLGVINKHLSNLAFNLVEVNPEISKLSTTFTKLTNHTIQAKNSFSSFNAGLSVTERRTEGLIGKVDRLSKRLRNVSHAGEGAMGGIGGRFGAGAAIGMLGRAVLPVGGLYAAGHFAKSSFESASHFEAQVGQLQARGFNQSQIAEIRKFSVSQNIPGVSYNAMIEAYSDALMATQDPSKAKILAPQLAKGQFAAKQLFGGMSSLQQQELIRFAEFRGRGNFQKIQEQLGVGIQMMALSGGTIKPNQLAQFMRYGGGAVSNLSNASLLAMEPILQMRGGAKSGTALQTMNMQLIGGNLGGRNKAMSLQSLGMLGPVQFDQNGRPVGSKFGTFKYANMLRTDPFGFLTQKYLPALSKQGITDPGKIEERIMYDFSRTAGQILTTMYENQDKIFRVLISQGKLAPGSELFNIATKTPGGAQARLSAAWQNLAVAFGEFEKPAVILGMNALAKVLEDLASFFNRLNEGKINPFILKKQPLNISLADQIGVSSVASSMFKSIKNAFSGMEVKMDGQKVGKVVTKHQAADANLGGVWHTTSVFNPALDMTPASFNIVGGGT